MGTIRMCTFSVLCILSVHAVIAVASRSRKKRAQEYKAKENILGNSLALISHVRNCSRPHTMHKQRGATAHMSRFFR